MQCEINDINDFTALSQQLDTITDQLSNSVGQLNSIIKSAHNYDGIDVVSAANILRSNLKIISSDMKNVSRNVSGYLNGINVLNRDDISGQINSFSLESIFSNIGDFISNDVVAPVGNLIDTVSSTGSNLVARFLPVFGDDKASEAIEENSNESKERVMPLYNQLDYPNVEYGGGSVASSGCGITSLAMVASYLTGDVYTPDQCAALGNNVVGHEVSNVGRMLTAADKIGLNYTELTTNEIMTSLQSGKVVICLINDSHHFVVLKGLTEDGKVLVNDPYGPFQDAKDFEGHTLTYSEWGELMPNDINITPGRIWVFDKPEENKFNTNEVVKC